METQTRYAERVAALEADGLSTSDAQAAADAELLAIQHFIVEDTGDAGAQERHPDDLRTEYPASFASALEALGLPHWRADEAATLPSELREAGEELREALESFARELRRAGARDSDSDPIRHFCNYQLADLEGRDAGWLGSGFLRDALGELLDGDAQDDR